MTDVLFRGGRVIDPANDLDGVMDVAVSNGRIRAVGPNVPAEGAEIVDVSGQIITPGLVDLHTHVYWGGTYWGIEPDPVAARSGVTTWLDVGSSGSYNFAGLREFIIERSAVHVYALLHLSSIGLVAPTWELANPDYWDVDLAAETIERNRDVLLGIKIRMDGNAARGVGAEPMKHARELADRVGLPLMTHIGSGPPSLGEITPYLRPGDILTHCFTGHDMNILGKDGHVRADIRALQEQGMFLDIGHGTGSFSFDVAEAMLADGVLPDAISTDIHQLAVQGPAFDMPTTLTKFMALGMSLPEVIRRATINPVRIIGLEDAGTLTPGRPADIAVFALESGDFTYYDAMMNARSTESRLVSVRTYVGGQELPRRNERPAHFFARIPDVQQPVIAAGSGQRVADATSVSAGQLQKQRTLDVEPDGVPDAT